MMPDMAGLLLLGLVVVLAAGYLLIQGLWRMIAGLGQALKVGAGLLAEFWRRGR